MICYFPPISAFYLSLNLEFDKLSAISILFASKPVPYPILSYENVRSVRLFFKELPDEELSPKRPERIPLPLHVYSMLQRKQIQESFSLYIKSIRNMEVVIIDRYYYIIESARKWIKGLENPDIDSFDDILIYPYENGEMIPLVMLLGDEVSGTKNLITRVTKTVNVLYYTKIRSNVFYIIFRFLNH